MATRDPSPRRSAAQSVNQALHHSILRRCLCLHHQAQARLATAALLAWTTRLNWLGPPRPNQTTASACMKLDSPNHACLPSLSPLQIGPRYLAAIAGCCPKMNRPSLRRRQSHDLARPQSPQSRPHLASISTWAGTSNSPRVPGCACVPVCLRQRDSPRAWPSFFAAPSSYPPCASPFSSQSVHQTCPTMPMISLEICSAS